MKKTLKKNRFIFFEPCKKRLGVFDNIYFQINLEWKS